MREMLEEKLARFENLESQMTDPDVLSDSSRMAAIAREHGSLAKLVKKYRRFKVVLSEVEEVRELAENGDAEEREMAEEELQTLLTEREEIWNELLDTTIGGDDANRRRCVLEIRAGTGGDEAALFARNLYEMYKRYAEVKGWKYKPLESSPTELGRLQGGHGVGRGRGCFRELQYESGGHRVTTCPRDRSQGPYPHVGGYRGSIARTGRREVDLKPDDYEVEPLCSQ